MVMSLGQILDEIREPDAASASAVPAAEPDALFTRFEHWVSEARGLSLYPAQEEALLGLALGSNVILATPTGTGKSLVAMGAHFFALAEGRRTVYTAPIKALVSEKFFELVAAFGTQRVGMLTGDTSINPGAPILCCTAEILANLALRDGQIDSNDLIGNSSAVGGENGSAVGSAPAITQVVMDEFHFYADPDRGWAWQVPLLLMNNTQFLLMSATLGDMTEMVKDLSRRTSRDTALVTHAERPVPLHYGYELRSVHEVVELLLAERGTPAYLVHFNQSHAVEQAQALASIKLVDRAQRDEIAAAIGEFKFSTGFGQTLSRLVRSGIGVHHAGMLPRYRRLVEQLAQRGLLRVICGTDTLGVGINVPIRTVVITALTKFDGQRMRRLSAREFHQIAGRAGRAGFDTEGDVIALAPEHEAENARAEAKAAAKASGGGKGGKKPKPVKKKSAPQGFIAWSEQTLDKLVAAEPEPLQSRMRVTHGMLLSIIGRGEEHEGDALSVVRTLIFDSHEAQPAQFVHARNALEIFRTLRNSGVIDVVEQSNGQRLLRLTVDLQANFALDQPLSVFALAAIELLDPESPSYPLDVISIIEATLEDPRAVLRAQEHKARGEAIAAMKAEGIEYDERMERLEEVTHPQPLRELLGEAYDAYVREVPWARDYELRPKSVVRDMIERAFGFRDLVSFYGLGRAEGGVLRYLSDAFRAFERSVPGQAKTAELSELIEWLGEVVRQVDSSLLDEWRELANPESRIEGDTGTAHAHGTDAIDLAPPTRSVIVNERAFTVMIRNAVFQRVLGAAFERIEELVELEGANPAPLGWHSFGAPEWNAALDAYFADYDSIGTGPEARSLTLLTVDRSPITDDLIGDTWSFRQVLDDPAGDRDWAIEGVIDLGASEAAGDAIVRVTGFGPHRG